MLFVLRMTRKRTAGVRLSRLVALFASLGFAAAAQTSIWSGTAIPQVAEAANDGSSVTVGLKFYSDIAGKITGIRFYKGTGNGGSHVGTLWTSAGIKLASVTFSGESASGWQQANFSSPVGISANTPYVVSYLAPGGHYANDQSYPWSSLKTTPVHVSGSDPGVFAYGASTTFPTATWNASNYWVDVVFAAATSSTVTVSGVIAGGGGATVALNGSNSVTTTASASGSFSFSGVVNGTYTVTPSKDGTTFTPATQSVTVNGANVSGINFAGTAASSIWSSAARPGTQQVTNDNSSVTLGVKFYSDVPGSVTGIRFYKGPNNKGTHVVNLWNSSKASLANATAADETASGWQQVNFATPVKISANTTYVASYLAAQGSYALDTSYGWAAVNASPLHVADSTPGVFAYGSAATYPGETWQGSNYWVDLVFVPGSSSGSGAGGVAAYSISGTVNGTPATLTLSGAGSGTVKTASNGTFSFPSLANGSYLVAPSQQGYFFTPSTSVATVNGANVSGLNFTAQSTPPVAHAVTLKWSDSASAGIAGYKVYRANTAGGPYSLLTDSPTTNTSYIDSAVSGNRTYYYVTTAVDRVNNESVYSNEAAATIPAP